MSSSNFTPTNVTTKPKAVKDQFKSDRDVLDHSKTGAGLEAVSQGLGKAGASAGQGSAALSAVPAVAAAAQVPANKTFAKGASEQVKKTNEQNKNNLSAAKMDAAKNTGDMGSRQPLGKKK